MVDNEKLLPCPFCGGEVNLRHDHTTEDIDTISHAHPTTGCPLDAGVSAFLIGNENLVAAWNTRTEAKTLPADDVREVLRRVKQIWGRLCPDVEGNSFGPAFSRLEAEYKALSHEIDALLKAECSNPRCETWGCANPKHGTQHAAPEPTAKLPDDVREVLERAMTGLEMADKDHIARKDTVPDGIAYARAQIRAALTLLKGDAA